MEVTKDELKKNLEKELQYIQKNSNDFIFIDTYIHRIKNALNMVENLETLSDTQKDALSILLSNLNYKKMIVTITNKIKNAKDIEN